MKWTPGSLAFLSLVIILAGSIAAFARGQDTLSPQTETIVPEFQYINETATNLSGGNKTGTTNINFFSGAIGINLEKLAGLKSTKFYTRVIYKTGGMPNEFFGTLQGISNLEAVDIFALQDCWFEKEIGDKAAVLFGIHDLNTDFDVKSSSALFTQPSHAIGSEFAGGGINGPSIFPFSSLALRLRYDLNENLRLKIAVFDGVPNSNHKFTEVKLSVEEGALLVLEMAARTADTGFAGIGGWYFSGKSFTVNAGDPPAENEFRAGSSGAYCYYDNPEVFEFNLIKLGMYARFGLANSLFSKVHYYFGCGAILQNVIVQGDIAGVCYAIGRLNPEFSGTRSLPRYESAIEFSYNRDTFSWLEVQPTIVYVMNPAGTKNSNKAFGGSIRFIAEF